MLGQRHPLERLLHDSHAPAPSAQLLARGSACVGGAAAGELEAAASGGLAEHALEEVCALLAWLLGGPSPALPAAERAEAGAAALPAAECVLHYAHGLLRWRAPGLGGGGGGDSAPPIPRAHRRPCFADPLRSGVPNATCLVAVFAWALAALLARVRTLSGYKKG